MRIRVSRHLILCLVFGIGGCTTLLFGRSYLEYHDQRFGKVIEETTAKLVTNPNDAELYIARGRAHYCKREYQEALSNFKRAVVLDPDNAEAYRGRGMSSKVVDFQSPADGVIRYPHLGYVTDTNRANALQPERLEKEINQDFGYISQTTNEFVFPVTGFCIEPLDLILGSSTKKQAAEALPPDWYNQFGPVPVYKPTKPRIGKVGKVVENARYKYEPDLHPEYRPEKVRRLLLVFDRNDKLVVIRVVDSMHLSGFGKMLDEVGNERLKLIARKKYEKYQNLMFGNQFKEAYRENIAGESKVMRGEISPCVTVDISVPVKPRPDYVIYTVEYIYTCPTK